MLLGDSYRGPQNEWIIRHRGERPRTPTTGPDEIPRQEVARMLLNAGPAGWTNRLGKPFNLVGWRFAGDGTKLDSLAFNGDATAAPFEVDPDGFSTAIGDALDRVAHQAGGSAERPRAIVLISDGAWNTGSDPTEVARVLGRLGTPVYVIGVGDPNPPRDVAVLALRTPKRLYLGDEMVLTADVIASGIGAVRIPVQLFCEGELVETREIGGAAGTEGNRPVSVKFSVVPSQPGVLHYSVRIPEQPGERETKNNQASATVEVDEKKIRVLMIDSEPRWQFRFLRNAMERDSAVTLKLCLLRPGVGPISGEGYIAELPADKKKLAEYDVVVLGDVERGKLSDDFLKELSEMVRLRSAALMVMAGRKGCYRQLANSPLGAILPVTLGEVGEVSNRGGAQYNVELTEVGRGHLLTRLAGSTEENEAVWSRFQPLRWAAPVSGVAPGADALLVHPDRLAGAAKLPLLAVQQVGAGKVMFCGIDESWRWRQEVGDKYFYRFWAQALRWMVKKPFGEGDQDAVRARLSLERTESNVGEKVQVEAYVIAPDGYPLQNGRVWLRVEPEGGEGKGEQIAMQPTPGGWGIYRASFTPGRAGTYVIRPIVAEYGNAPLNSPVTLTVARADLEKNFLAQDRSALAAIAQASGGELLTVDQVDRLVDLLSARAESRVQTAEFSPTRHWAFYVAIVLLLSTLWLVRKRGGLA
ncbi:MAG: VWA domain-containing protein [Phycisphaerae bacterium]|nr:VWA domain-containing protein [Phycisphaerae bacterium]